MHCWCTGRTILRTTPMARPNRLSWHRSSMQSRHTRKRVGRSGKWPAAKASPPVCNLYSINKKRDMLAHFLRVPHNRSAAFEPASAIFPGHIAPVVRPSVDGEREIVLVSWGFVLPQNGRAPRRVTNVRDDKILESRFWRGSFEERRCLLPASSFCEPNGDVKPV